MINRVLFSLYCLENSIAYFFDNYLIRRLAIGFCKLLYKYDPFGNIRPNNKSLDEYIKHTFSSAKEAAENEDYGLSIANSQGTLCSILFFYFFSILLVAKHVLLLYKISPFQIILPSLLLSALVGYALSFKNDKYKSYFSTFRKAQNNNKWHIITAIVCFVAVVTFYLSIVTCW